MASPFDGSEKTADDRSQTCLAFPPSALAAPVSRYRVGSVLSEKYRLESLIGEGGMGAVWRASNLQLGLPVAIKLIRADLDRDALRARLQLEARSVAKLGHPAIVRVYDVGESELGDPFIVMELLHGQTLAQLLVKGRLSAVRAVQLLLPIIDALLVAHARGIVHRDLKPDNLLIALEDQRTQPKILDFGIAKLTDPRDTNQRLTEIGTVVGSPDYMSPEQARGRDDVDYRTDIWSLCVVLYEAITGVPPFSAPNYNALLRTIVEDEPKSLADHAAGDAQLWDILKKGLAKDPTQRQPSMLELGRSLAAWLLSHGAAEDACNTSLESKWLSRASDPLSLMRLAEVLPEVARPRSASFNSKLTHDSRAGKSGVDSGGPFTATIRPRIRAHQRAWAALASGALLGMLGLGSTWAAKGRAEPPATHAALTPREETPNPTATIALAATRTPAVSATTTVDPAPPDSASQARLSRQPPALSPPASPALVHAPMALGRTRAARSPNVTTAAPRSEAPAAKPEPRALDLIAPY